MDEKETKGIVLEEDIHLPSLPSTNQGADFETLIVNLCRETLCQDQTIRLHCTTVGCLLAIIFLKKMKRFVGG